MNNNTKKLLKSYLIIILLAVLMALNYEIFILKNQFAPAGLNGIATMIQYLCNFSVGYISLIVNIPLIIITFAALNKEYALKTLVFVIVFSVVLLAFNYTNIVKFAYVTDNGTSTVLAPIAAGIINGFIYGIAIKENASTGGTDLIASYIRSKKPEMDFVWIVFMLNVAVATISYIVYGFKLEPVILCVIYCFFTSKVSDMMIKGGKEAIRFEIVTNRAEEISQEIISKLKHGVTLVNATGMYSHDNKELLICIVNKHQIAEFQRIIEKYPGSFACMSSVSETVGNFKKI